MEMAIAITNLVHYRCPKLQIISKSNFRKSDSCFLLLRLFWVIFLISLCFFLFNMRFSLFDGKFWVRVWNFGSNLNEFFGKLIKYCKNLIIFRLHFLELQIWEILSQNAKIPLKFNFPHKNL
jgi:hypothetical protein